MQAIHTKYIPATNHRGSRIKATCERGSITISHDTGLSDDDSHKLAAAMLQKRFAAEDHKQYGTPHAENPWMRPTVMGGLPGGGNAHVYLEANDVSLRNAAAAFLDQPSVTNRRVQRLALNRS